MTDIDLIVYNDILKRQQEIQTDNRIQLEIPSPYEDLEIRRTDKEEKEKEPRRVIIIDL